MKKNGIFYNHSPTFQKEPASLPLSATENNSVNAITTAITLDDAEQQVRQGSLQPELESLIARCLDNDRAAQEQLYKKFYGKMMGTCMRYLSNPDDALEALNTGFLKVFQRLDQYKGQGSFEGWVYHIIRNSIIDHIRSRVRYRETGSLEGMEEEQAVPQSALQGLYVKDLLKMLDVLPETTRLVFNMFAMDGFKHEEIAGALGISAGTSKWHVSEARRILKDRILKTNQSVK